MKEKMKREMKRDERKDDFFKKMFQDPQTRQMNEPKMFRIKIPFGRIILPLFFESSESDRVSFTKFT